MYLEIDTSLEGVTVLLLALAWVNLLDAQRDPEVARELTRRCVAPRQVGWIYTRDLPRRDRWSTFVPLSKRTRASQPIKADCEDQTAAHAAAIHLLEPARRVEVAITLPAPGQQAHAYCLVDGEVFDPCTWNGMGSPGADFYGSGETARLPLADPRLLFDFLRRLRPEEQEPLFRAIRGV
ncbi:MAG: hypothetical protein HUU26_13170 [Gemmatimonadaceae bacterium]|nr:hypothetical protein [Polyangiaceae bacterium]NUQ13257.1 hypothetical protein [Gemmatimonadaceae bacterium]